MSLLDEILQANQAFIPEGPAQSGYRARRHLCLVTCVDPRLTRFMPQALGIERGDATLVRVPGAHVVPGSPLLRSIAAVIYINDCTEVLVLPHTDCGTARVRPPEIVESMARQGVAREAVPGDVGEFFGLVADVREAAAETVRALRDAPYLPRKLPIHSALIDTVTGKLSVLERAE
jgi:carbonic anhydrase